MNRTYLILSILILGLTLGASIVGASTVNASTVGASTIDTATPENAAMSAHAAAPESAPESDKTADFIESPTIKILLISGLKTLGASTDPDLRAEPGIGFGTPRNIQSLKRAAFDSSAIQLKYSIQL